MINLPVRNGTTETHITADETAYLRKVLAVRQQAEGIYSHYAGYLAEKYGLAQGDTVSEVDGTINRAAASE